MTMDDNAVSEVESCYRRLQNELVTPEYRRFCDQLRIPFHFWDELPDTDFDSDIALAEMPLHARSMALFNRIKPELTIFGDEVIRYQFTSWDGTFSYRSESIEDFLLHTSDQNYYLKMLEQRFERVSAGLVLLLGLVCFAALYVAFGALLPEHRGPGDLLAVVISSGFGLYLWRRLNDIPRRLLDEQMEDLEKDLKELRVELARIRGNHPNPLLLRRERHLGDVLLEELNDSMNSEQLRRFIRRVQSGFKVVRPEDDKRDQE